MLVDCASYYCVSVAAYTAYSGTKGPLSCVLLNVLSECAAQQRRGGRISCSWLMAEKHCSRQGQGCCRVRAANGAGFECTAGSGLLGGRCCRLEMTSRLLLCQGVSNMHCLRCCITLYQGVASWQVRQQHQHCASRQCWTTPLYIRLFVGALGCLLHRCYARSSLTPQPWSVWPS